MFACVVSRFVNNLPCFYSVIEARDFSLAELFERKRNITKYDLRGSSTSLQLSQPKTEKLKKSFSYDGAKLWNSPPVDMRNSDTLTIFKEIIRAHTD